jgi:hypothetical protein
LGSESTMGPRGSRGGAGLQVLPCLNVMY